MSIRKVSTVGMSREEWLNIRKGSIGGSDSKRQFSISPQPMLHLCVMGISSAQEWMNFGQNLGTVQNAEGIIILRPNSATGAVQSLHKIESFVI